MSIEIFLNELAPLINVDCGTMNPKGVMQIAELMQKKYEAMGWYVEKQPLGDAVGPGLKITNRLNAQAYDLMLIGHLDTVFPEGTVSKRPMSIRGNRVYGPGVADMKSGVLLMQHALRELDAAILNDLSICVILNPDEEIGSTYSHDWISHFAKRARLVLVCEAARVDGSLVKARKGVANYEINFKGVSAHAGNDPDKGRSAILEMAHWTLALHALSDYEKGTTLNVGVVAGGTTANTVAEYAKAELDVRFWDNAEYDKIEAAIHTLITQPFNADVSVEIKRLAHKPAMFPNEETEKFMDLVEKAGKKVGIDITWKSVGGGSDANLTASLGIPSLDGLGPIGGNFHSEAEYLEIESILPRIALLKSIIQAIRNESR